VRTPLIRARVGAGSGGGWHARRDGNWHERVCVPCDTMETRVDSSL